MLEVLSLSVAVGLNILLGLFVFLKNTRSQTHRLFFLLAICFGLYSFINYSSLHPYLFSQLLWIKIDIFNGVFLFTLTYLTFDVFPNPAFEKKSWIRRILVTFSLFVAALTLTPYVFPSLSMVGGHVQPTISWGIYFYALNNLSLLTAFTYVLVRKYIKAQRREKQQLKFVIFGILAALGSILIVNFALVQIFHITQFIALGSLCTLLFTGSFSYAIVKHHLLDIRAVVARSVAYVLLLATLGGLYSLGIFAVSNLLLHNGSAVGAQQLFVNMALALVLTLTFQPLRRFFERFTDKIFFRDKYDSQALLNQITQTLASEINLDTILEKTLAMIAQAVRVNFGQYMIFDDGKVYKVEHYGRLPEQLITPSELKVLNRTMLVADELEAGERKDVMDKHHVRLSLVLRTKDEFVGFLLLGDKLSGDIYSTQDIELFQILANELAVALVNAKAYEEISRFNVTLQDKVDQATARLRTANKHLKELDVAKDEFISMASHQLRTPLTTIKGYISMLQEGDAGKVTTEQNEFLSYAYDGSERMVGLISDLLNVSRMNSGKFMIDRTDIDPVAMVSDEVRQLMSHAEAKHLKLIWNPPKEKIPHVQLDDNKTRQVIMNYIDNAIYYTKAGSVTVALAQKGDQLELRVTDTGIGVPKAAQEKLFGKFFRAGNAQQMRPDGTGLGLYLAKRVVEDQGGKVIFESSEGKGSTFGFLLPMKVPAGEKPSPNIHKPDEISLHDDAKEPAKVSVKA